MDLSTEPSMEADAGAVPPAKVREQLRRMLSDARFANPARRDLLGYLVEETLVGRGERLKGFTIATRVFGRGDDFDGQSDPVVRIEARRLRRDLQGYYHGPGRADPVEIGIPKGRYIATFAWRGGVSSPGPFPMSPPPPSPVPSPPPAASAARPAGIPRRVATVGAIAAVLVVVLAGEFLARTPSDPADAGAVAVLRAPSVLVTPFDATTGGDAARFLADGITNDLITNLMRFPDFRLFSMPEGLDDTAAGGEQADVSYVVSGEVATDPERVRLSARLVDARTKRVVWSEAYERQMTPAGLIALRDGLAGEIATALAQPYGVVRTDILDSDVGHVPTELESYHCVLRAYQYRRGFDTAARGPLRTCLEEAVARDPGYAEAWAMLGWLHLDDGRYAAATEAEATRAYNRGLAAASKAVALDPGSILGLKALSSINFYKGNHAEGERLAREALAHNPHDPDTLAQLGWRLAVRGNFDKGLPYLRRAIERSMRPPGWYFHLITIDHLLRGDHEGMLAVAQRAAVDGSGMSQSFIAIAHAHLGNPEAAREALDEMARRSPRLGKDPARVYRTHQATDEIVDALMNGLRLAGWRPPTAEGISTGSESVE